MTGTTVLLPTGASPVEVGAVLAGVSESDVELGEVPESDVDGALAFDPGFTTSTTAVDPGPIPLPYYAYAAHQNRESPKTT